MAIERPDTYSSMDSVNFKFYTNVFEPSMTLQRVKYVRINCVGGQMRLTSSAGGGNPINVAVLSSSGAGNDSFFELRAPEGALVKDITITGISTGGTSGQAYITYILG
jgi:hypothetical protein